MCFLKIKVTKIRLYLPAGFALPSPPLGPILGQYGVNTVSFCNDFNKLTENFSRFFEEFTLLEIDQDEDFPVVFDSFLLVVDILIFEDKSYSFLIEKPTVSYILRLLTDLNIGSTINIVASLPLSEIIFLAQFKFPYLPLFFSLNMIRGTTRSMGIAIINDL